MRAESSVNAKRLFKRGWVEWSACSDRGRNHKKKRRVKWKAKGLQAVERKWQVMNSGTEGAWNTVGAEERRWEMFQLRARMVLTEHSFSHGDPRGLTRN